MKKKTLILILILILAITIGITACRKPTEEKKGLVLEYKVDGELYRSVNYKGELVLPEAPYKEGYTFEGWYMEDGFVTPLNSTILDSKKDGSTISIYAYFKRNPNEGITLDFMVEGAFYKTILYKGVFTLPEAPERKGFDFEGWYIDQDFTTPLSKEILDNTKDGETLSIYARFVEGEKQGIAINYTLDGEIYAREIYKGELVLPEEPQKENCIFYDWILPSGENLTKEYLDTLDDGEEIAVIASFIEKEKKNLTVVFIVDGEEYSELFCEYSLKLPEEPTEKNMVFKGWYLDSQLTTPLTEKDFYTFTTGSRVTVYGTFVEEIKIILTINFVDDTFDYFPISYTVNEQLENVPDAVKQGYQFKGWFLDENYTIPLSKEALDLYTESGEVNAYSYFEKNIGTTLLFMVDGEEYDTFIYDGIIYVLPEAPSKVGLAFENWYLDQEYTELYTYEYMLAQEDGTIITLYAKYVDKVGQKLTFYVFDEPVYSYLYLDDLTLPTSPYKFGYRFNGWYFMYRELSYYISEEMLRKLPDGAEISVYADMIEVNRLFSSDVFELNLKLDGSFTLYYSPEEKSEAVYSGTYTEKDGNVKLSFSDTIVENIEIDEVEEWFTYEQGLVDYCVANFPKSEPKLNDGYEGNYKQYRTDDEYLGFLEVYLSGYGNAVIKVSIYGGYADVGAYYTITEVDGVKGITFTLKNEEEKVLSSVINDDEIMFTDEMFVYFRDTYEIKIPSSEEPEPEVKPVRGEMDFILPEKFTYTGIMTDGDYTVTLRVEYDGKIAKATVTSDYEIDGIPAITYMDSQKIYYYDNDEWTIEDIGNMDFYDIISDYYILTLYSDSFSYSDQEVAEEDADLLKYSYTVDIDGSKVVLTVDKASHIVLEASVDFGNEQLSFVGSIVYTADTVTLPELE